MTNKTIKSITPLCIENAQSALLSQLITAHEVSVLDIQRCKSIFSDIKTLAIAGENIMDEIFQKASDAEQPVVFTHNYRGILLTPINITNIDKLIECCKDEIIVFKYDIQWTFAEFMSKLDKTIELIPEGSLELFGWIFHGELENLQIVSDKIFQIKNHHNLEQWQHIIDIVTKIKTHMKSSFNRIDFLGCSLTQNPHFQMFKSLLLYTSNMITTSSDDLTGNIIGANWMLEDGDINLIGTYFVPETPEMMKEFPIEFSFTLLTQATLKFVDTIRNPKTFKGKSPLQIASIVFEIVSYIPGPVGFVAGLVEFGLNTTEYSNKVKSGKATTNDHVDFSMSALGTLVSCVPNSRTANGFSRMTQTNKIVSRTNGIGKRVKLLGAELDCMTNSFTTTVQGMDLMSKSITGITELHEKFTALERVIQIIVTETTDDEDIEKKTQIFRQSLIEIVSSIARDELCKDRIDNFAQIIATQYGTCTVNGMDKFSTEINWQSILRDYRGIFIDNETKVITTDIKNPEITIKINPRTIVYVWSNSNLSLPSILPSIEYYINEDPLDVMIVKIVKKNNDGSPLSFRARALDNVGSALIYNGFGTSNWCVRTVMNYLGIRKIVLKPKTGIIISGIRDICDIRDLSNPFPIIYSHYNNKESEYTNEVMLSEYLCFVEVFEYDGLKRPSE